MPERMPGPDLRSMLRRDLHTVAEAHRQRIENLAIEIEELLTISNCTRYQGLLALLCALAHQCKHLPGEEAPLIMYRLLTEMGQMALTMKPGKFEPPPPDRPKEPT
jgi:hypothetical protein